jgi:peptidoglycan-N-acetylglucosamine deacetylase
MQAAISIDLDGLACYYRIHGLGEPPAELEHVILERALPRAAALFARHGLRVTWFVIGRDVDVDRVGPDREVRVAHAERLRTLARGGDELANHSYSHPYALARLPPAELVAEIASCDRVLRAIARPVKGFRSPGYDVSPAMLDALATLGYRYDSSLFPAPGYYAAKVAVIAALRVLGRTSGAVLVDPRSLTAPAEPYRPAMTAPWRRGQAPLVELPIAVTPWARVPAIGTSLLLAPPWLRRRLLDAMARRRVFNLELHGIDFVDADKDGIPGELVARQPDLRLSIDDKLARFEQILDDITARWQVVTLAEVARDVQRAE